MAHTSLIQVLKVNESRKGVSKKSGNPYEMQDAECALLDDSGQLDCVGLLPIPRDMMGKVERGTYTASFAMRRDMQTGRLGSVLVGLVPVKLPAGPGGKA